MVGEQAVESDGRTVGELLADMNAQYPGFREQITDDDGPLHRFVNIYVNDEDIRYLQRLETPVERRRRGLDPAGAGRRRLSCVDTPRPCETACQRISP